MPVRGSASLPVVSAVLGAAPSKPPKNTTGSGVTAGVPNDAEATRASALRRSNTRVRWRACVSSALTPR